MERILHRHRIFSLAAMSLGAFLLAACTPVAIREKPKDVRERLALTPREREMVLSEMRLMLESLNGIAQGIESDDLEIIENWARGAGIGIAADLDPGLARRLPQSFIQIGMKTHRDFENLADQMKAGKSSEEAVKGLTQITGNCVGCHTAYKLVEAYPPISRFGPPPNL